MIPHIVHLCWAQGESQAPDIVKFCIQMWRDLNPDAEVRIYTDSDINQMLGGDIPEHVFSGLKVQFKTDLLRTKLLATQGGIWADASCLPVLPLHHWLPRDSSFDFSAPHSPRVGRTISNWFMLARSGSELMNTQYQALCEYWRTPKHLLPQNPDAIAEIEKNWRLFISDEYAHSLRIAPYFLWHYHFTRTLETDDQARQLFESSPVLIEHKNASFVNSFGVAAANGSPRPTNKLVHFLSSTDCPVQKINWRIQYDYPRDLMRRTLLDRARTMDEQHTVNSPSPRTHLLGRLGKKLLRNRNGHENKASANTPHSLNFIVSGVPRSGTSAFARSLNLHPQLFCGIECFPINHDYADFSAPDSFLALAQADSRTRAQDNSLKVLNGKLSTGEKSLHYGNKLPRYYFCLWRLQKADLHPRIVHVFRDPIATANSWDRRAANPQDALWQRGQIGLFAVAECYIALMRLAQLDTPVCLVSHARYFSLAPDDYSRVLTALGVNPDAKATAAFHAEYFQRKAGTTPPPPAWAGEIDLAGLSTWVETLAEQPQVLLSDPAHVDALATRWSEAMPQITRHLLQAIQDNAEVRAYTLNWLDILKHHLNKDCAAVYAMLTPMLEALDHATHAHD